jgi:lipopolysaccharide biosynthesis protein
MRELALTRDVAQQIDIESERVALVASYSPTCRVTRSLQELVTQLETSGYQVLLIRASEDSAPLEWLSPAERVTVLRRPNVGYDFGSWAEALNRMPAVRRAEHVILTNDSLVGPFESIAPLLEDFESTDADVWGAVVNPQIREHLQSFFIGFQGGVLNDAVLRSFWRRVRPQVDKMDYVFKYEVGLTIRLWSESYAMTSAHPFGSMGFEAVNPTLERWRNLLDRGFPFVKRALLVEPADEEKASAVTQEIRERYGVDVAEWL